jgi:BirA family biotin operon repressor/biotin-[acetyl-CoA-carboxylase] ligase
MPPSLDLSRVKARLQGGASDWTIEQFERVGSTMDIARERALAGAAAGTVVAAELQTAGRGRLGRSWISLAGSNLYFTVVLRPSLQALRRLAMIAPLAVAEAIDTDSGLHAEIKWPNDVQLNGLKCSGVLIDAEVQGKRPAFALVGIGINVNLDMAAVPELHVIATSIAAQLGRPVDREDILAATLSNLAALCDAVERNESVQDRWKARLNTLGREVRVTSRESVDSGRVEDVNEEGSLLLRRADGTLVSIAAGEVTLRV